MSEDQPRIDLKIDPALEWRLRQAAVIAGASSLSQFILDAAATRADDLLEQNVVLPAATFDELKASLDETPVANENLAKLGDKPRPYRWR